MSLPVARVQKKRVKGFRVLRLLKSSLRVGFDVGSIFSDIRARRRSWVLELCTPFHETVGKKNQQSHRPSSNVAMTSGREFSN